MSDAIATTTTHLFRSFIELGFIKLFMSMNLPSISFHKCTPPHTPNSTCLGQAICFMPFYITTKGRKCPITTLSIQQFYCQLELADP